MSKRRLEVIASINNITVYDDFAHHPTAIDKTLTALRAKVVKQRIIVILEPRSNTMKSGVHSNTLADSLAQADLCYLYQPDGVQWDLSNATSSIADKRTVYDNTENIIIDVARIASPEDHIVIMSNGGFQNLHRRLISFLEESFDEH